MGPLRWSAARASAESTERDTWIGRLRSSSPEPLSRVFLQDPKPHERDRLKHVGRRVEGQTVKAVRNGEGGATRGWKPATGKPEHRRRTAAGSLTGIGCRRTRQTCRCSCGLARQNNKGWSRDRHGSRPHRPTRWFLPRPAERLTASSEGERRDVRRSEIGVKAPRRRDDRSSVV